MKAKLNVNGNETIEVTVLHFYMHPILYPFMSQSLFEVLADAFLHKQDKAEVPKDEFDYMIKAYLNTLNN